MTIIQLNKNNHKKNFLVSILMMVSIVMAVGGIFIYNQLVSLRHEVKKQENNIQQAEVQNAELKNNLYSILNEKNIESLIITIYIIIDSE